MQPLIVTLALDEQSQCRFDDLRAAHFPAERNHLQAHVTLFHALPGEQEEQVRADLARAADRPAMTVRVTGLRSLGRGVAYVLQSEELSGVRGGLAEQWRPWLTPQDAAKHDPHVTVQNKVAPPRARALLAELQSAFAPYDVTARGLALWRYLGGPWEAVDEAAFASSVRANTCW